MVLDGTWPVVQTYPHERSHMPDVETLSKRPIESQWEIGVGPLLTGSVFFLLGIPDVLERFLPQTALAQNGTQWLALLFAAAFAAILIWGTRFISRKWLLLPIVLVPLVLVPIVIAYAFSSYGSPPAPVSLDSDRLVMPGFAVLFGAIALYEGRKRKSPLLLAFGTYLMCLALLLWWLPLSPTERSGLLNVGAGGPLGAFGATRLRAFLRASPKPANE
jgi:hypothetical protein